MNAYKEEGRTQWQGLREALYQACDQDKVFGKMFERFYDGKVDKDAVIRSLLKEEIGLKPARYTLMTHASKLRQQHPGRSGNGVLRMSLDMLRNIMVLLPFMQGSALFILWSALPAFLAATFLSRRMAPLVMFMGILVSVKAWTLIWVVLDKVSTVWAGVEQTWGGPALWQAPGLNMFIVLAAVILPLGLTVITTRRFPWDA